MLKIPSHYVPWTASPTSSISLASRPNSNRRNVEPSMYFTLALVYVPVSRESSKETDGIGLGTVFRFSFDDSSTDIEQRMEGVR